MVPSKVTKTVLFDSIDSVKLDKFLFSVSLRSCVPNTISYRICLFPFAFECNRLQKSQISNLEFERDDFQHFIISSSSSSPLSSKLTDNQRYVQGNCQSSMFLRRKMCCSAAVKILRNETRERERKKYTTQFVTK